jgi:hypothetical protein
VVIDYERAWLAMKEVVLSKRSHGQDGLLTDMTRIEIECRVPEGQEGFDPGPLRQRSNGATQSSSQELPASAGGS